MATNDGGPAFPQQIARDSSGEREFSGDFGLGGMSLRDWFAGQALAGYLASYAHPRAIAPPNPDDTARKVYEYADAMLAQRGEPR